MKNKKPKNTGKRISLSPDDVDAILCALPLVADADVDSPMQARLNRLSCNAAANKLTTGSSALSAEDLRVISVAIDFALDVISGTGNEFVSTSDIDAEWLADLSKYLFVYNRLRSVFGNIFGGNV